MLATFFNRVTLALTLVISAAMFQAPAIADTFGGIEPVSNQKLDRIRGGFSLQYELGQLKLALDMSRVSSINGSLAPSQQITGTSGGTLNVIQNGMNNAVSPSIVNSLPIGTLGTVIQNSLNDQVIRTFNVLNITVTSQTFAQAMAVQAIAQSALLQSLH